MRISSDRGHDRIARTQNKLTARSADALILSPGANYYYLSGHPETQLTPRHTFFIFSATGESRLFMSTNNESNARATSWVDTIETWDDDDDPIDALAEVLKGLGIDDESTILLDDHMWATFVMDLQELINAEFELASDVLMTLRQSKDKQEIEAITKAARIADEVSEEIRSDELVGLTENEVAAEIEYLMRKRGAEDSAFDTVVASGPNSAKPSYTAGSREIEAGDPVVLDFGAQVDMYLSDQTRTIVAGGTPPNEFENAFDIVREAQERAIEALEPGVVAKEIDKVARSVIEDAGYGENFLHVTGHGIGLGIHEPPYLMSGTYLGDGNELALEPGMVVTIEPGIYTDEWGIRIEDDVVITEDGYRRLSSSNHGWAPLK